MTQKCEKCGSDKIIPQVRVIDHGHYSVEGDLTVAVDEKPDAYIFKETTHTSVTAKVCGSCGFMELYADNPQSIYTAYQNQTPNLKLVK